MKRGTCATVRDVWIAFVSRGALAVVTHVVVVDAVAIVANTRIGSLVSSGFLACFLCYPPF